MGGSEVMRICKPAYCTKLFRGNRKSLIDETETSYS